MKKGIGSKLLVIVFVVAILGSAGCSSTKSSAGMAGADISGLPQIAGFADDIKDIPIPTELEWNRKKSMAIKTESFRGGLWNYRGRVDIISLKDYMVTSMQDNKWKLVGESASKDIMIAFVKPNKTCMMVLTDGLMGKTELNLYVTIDKSGAAALNPFGEAVSQ